MPRDHRTRCRPQRRRRGAILPLIAILLPVLILIMGFAVDVAHMQNVRLEMRAATDAAARAGANTLARTDKVKQAANKAQKVAEDNKIAGKALSLDSSNIVFGRSEPDANGKYVFTANAQPANSVRVTGLRLNGSSDGGVPLFFGRLYGMPTFEPRQTSTATFLNVDICLVIDQSTSMKNDVDSSEQGMSTADPRFCQPPGPNTRWAALDSAIHVFTDALRDSNAEEAVAMVTYSSDTKKDGFNYCGGRSPAAKLELHLAENLNKVDQKIEDLTTSVWNGNTFIEDGMRAGLSELKSSHARKHAEKIMIVLTDGRQTNGDCVAAAADCTKDNVIVHTVTFGEFADQEIMQLAAEAGKGEHHHANDGAELEDAFRELAAWVARLTQ